MMTVTSRLLPWILALAVVSYVLLMGIEAFAQTSPGIGLHGKAQQDFIDLHTDLCLRDTDISLEECECQGLEISSRISEQEAKGWSLDVFDEIIRDPRQIAAMVGMAKCRMDALVAAGELPNDPEKQKFALRFMQLMFETGMDSAAAR